MDITWREDGLRPPIVESWHRSRLAGLEPETALDTMDHAEVDQSSHLLRAAGPVLDELHSHLGETRLNSLLVDRDGRVVRRWCGDRVAASHFDRLRIDVGASVLEETIGTNAPGTVLETRSRVAVHGSEHFALPLRAFSCFGHPIVHPTTHRLEGVLDFTVVASEANSLLGPLLTRAVVDIEQRLLDGSRASERRLLAAFQCASRPRRAVVAVGDDLLLTNQAAADILGAGDLAVLRILARELARSRTTRTELELESGERVVVEGTLVSGTRGGALLHLAPAAPGARVAGGRSTSTVTAAPTVPLLFAGGPGTGRSTAARARATEPVTVLTTADALLDPTAWARSFAAAVRAGRGSVVVDGIELLPDGLLALVRRHAAAAALPRLLLISGPLDTLTGPAGALASLCGERVELAPLSTRLTELPGIASSMLRELGADPSLYLTSSALEALSAQQWPGNLGELRTVLAQVIAARHTGGITVQDLPPAYRAATPGKPLGPLDRAERDVIISALRQANGNKVEAARLVGISRTTLYAKMRSLGITTY